MAEQLINVDGVTIACEDRGSGPPIVLLHGFPLNRWMWAEQVAALSDRFRVIAPDLRGFGGSTIEPADVENGVGMERYAADVLGLLDAIGIEQPVVLVGFSMGGYAAWQFALAHPERLRGLVQCDTRAVADTEEAAAGRLKMAGAVMAAGESSSALAMLPKLLSSASLKSRPEIVARVRGMILATSPAGIAAAQRGMARREDVRHRLGEITCPALGIVGVEDAISPPAEMREIVASLPNARLVEIASAGHMTSVENAAAVTTAIRDFAQSD